MDQLLSNPVFNALSSGDAHLSNGNDHVKYFDEEVSPFAAFDEKYSDGFADLHQLLSPGRKILYANPQPVEISTEWKLLVSIAGMQFVLDEHTASEVDQTRLVPLSAEHVEEMIKLTALTKPGPFDKRTIEFGNYFGIFQNGKLAAMTGERLHVGDFTEVSAVCTHPDHLGKGFAAALLQHQINLILKTGKTPFLHVRADNDRAIALYERIGFKKSRPMNFYFLQNG